MKKINPHVLLGILTCSLLSSGILCAQSVKIPRKDWKVKADSVQASSTAEKAIDGNTSTHWHTKWGETEPLPHTFVVDLGKEHDVNGFIYTPRPDGGNGNINDYELHLSKDGQSWGEPVAKGSFEKSKEPNEIIFTTVPGVRFVRLTALSNKQKTNYHAAMSEFEVLEHSKEPPKVDFSVPVKIAKVGQKIRFTDKSDISPTRWEWTFSGGTPGLSSEQNPEVSYDSPGTYEVIAKVSNANGATTETRPAYIEVKEDIVNQALCLDGKDNNVAIGMGKLEAPWTLEAWVKGNDKDWKDEEFIIGGGEYSKYNTVCNEPLLLRKGKLASGVGKKLEAKAPLDDQWYHVAAVSDGTTTKLYLDGKEVASEDVSRPLICGTIGVQESGVSVFGGLIDEVRIWNEALSPAELTAWSGKRIDQDHPRRDALKAYYDFDQMTDEVAVNLVGKAPLGYHARNGRCDYKGRAPLAYTVANDNPDFADHSGPCRPLSIEIIPGEWDVDQGAKGDQILKLRIVVNGKETPLKLTDLVLDLSGSTDVKDIEAIRIYALGSSARSSDPKELFGKALRPSPKMVLKAKEGDEYTLAPGVNYFLVTADMAARPRPGNIVKATIPALKLNGDVHTPQMSNECLPKKVVQNSKNNPKILRVLQANIWHGGVHLGPQGPQRVAELLKSSGADVITMQEAYGSQNLIADHLGFELHTVSPETNLALYSRYPMEKLKTSAYFNSNPALIQLPNKKKVLLNACWLPYAYKPPYTTDYYNTGMNPEGWIKEDTELSVKTMGNLLDKDVAPYEKPKDIPVIIGGDFNSGSHLDWTEKAKSLHNGYVADLPTSKFMIEKGFKDSFRELNPDELTHPGGTFAVIYGHLQTSRIDYIYYKGKGIKAASSKTIRTPYEIDFPWPGDHAMVITNFIIE